MALHHTTFEQVNPTDEQKDDMQKVSDAAAEYAEILDNLLPEGPDKTYCLRLLRTVNMWARASLIRQPDGTPRT